METKKTKNVKRYNLPINDIYYIKDSYYTGGLENACICENCNRPISNVAVIENDKKEVFNVGLDCASTLSNLQNFYFLDLEFKELKNLLAKISKAKKQCFDLTYKIGTDGDLIVHSNGNLIFYTNIEFAKKYLKHILKEVSNPDKIGFEYTNTNIEKIEYFNKTENQNFKKVYNIDGFNFIVSVEPYFHLVTNEVSGYDLWLDGFKEGQSIYSKRCTSFSIGEPINIAMRNYYFNQYKN